MTTIIKRTGTNFDFLINLVNSNNINLAINELTTKFENQNSSGLIKMMMRRLSAFYLEYVCSQDITDDATFSIWIDFARQINSIEKIRKFNFVDIFLSVLAIKCNDPEFYINDRISDLLINLLPNCDDKFRHIKNISKTKLGESLLIKSLPEIINKSLLSSDELNKVSMFFLETYQKSVFKIIHNMVEPSPIITTTNLDIKTKIRDLLNCPDELANELMGIMCQLKDGKGNIKDDDETAAKYILASIKEDKSDKYDFSPILVREKEWINYLTLILKLDPPITEKFIITGAHWTAGEISIQEDGKVRIFLSDSFGYPKKGDGECWFIGLLKSAVFCDVLKNNTVEVYYPFEKRQNSACGCSIFALDDVRHFHTIDRYMNGEDLLSYLEKNNADEDIGLAENINLKICHLPDSLLRTTQSTKVFDILHDDVINKKGEKSIKSVEHEFTGDSLTQKQQNKRLDRKLENMVARLDKKISTVIQSENPIKNFEKFKKMANTHTYAGFKTRIEQQLTSIKPAPALGSPDEIAITPANVLVSVTSPRLRDDKIGETMTEEKKNKYKHIQSTYKNSLSALKETKNEASSGSEVSLNLVLKNDPG